MFMFRCSGSAQWRGREQQIKRGEGKELGSMQASDNNDGLWDKLDKRGSEDEED